MRIMYDREADALSILLADGEVGQTKNIAPGVEVDFDFDGRVLAIEFLNASKKYDIDSSGLEEPDPYYSLAAAAELYGLSPTTLRHQIERGVLPGVKFGRNWVVHRDDLDEYMKERSRKAKPVRSS